MTAISQQIPQPLTTKINLKITHLKFILNLPGVNELTYRKSGKAGRLFLGRTNPVGLGTLSILSTDAPMAPTDLSDWWSLSSLSPNIRRCSLGWIPNCSMTLACTSLTLPSIGTKTEIFSPWSFSTRILTDPSAFLVDVWSTESSGKLQDLRLFPWASSCPPEIRRKSFTGRPVIACTFSLRSLTAASAFIMMGFFFPYISCKNSRMVSTPS